MAGTLRIGHLSTFYHTAILLMAGGTDIDIDWRLFGTGPAIVEACSKGELDLAYIGLPPAIIGIDKGVGITCIAGGHMEGTVFCAKSHYRGFPEAGELHEILEQFCGLKIGVPGKGSIHDVLLNEYIERLGFKDRIEVVNYQWADQVLEAVVKNEVAAAAGTPALAVAVKRFAGGKIIYPPAKIWPNNPSYGIIVDRGFMKKNREAVESFLLLHEQATAFLRTKPNDAAKKIASFIRFIDEEFVFDTLCISPKYCALLTDDYISSTLRFLPVLKKLGYIKNEHTADEIFDTTLINKIHPEKDHYHDGITDEEEHIHG